MEILARWEVNDYINGLCSSYVTAWRNNLSLPSLDFRNVIDSVMDEYESHGIKYVRSWRDRGALNETDILQLEVWAKETVLKVLPVLAV